MLWRSGNDLTAQLRVGRQHAMEANQMETRVRHQGRQAFHELQRLHDDMRGALFVRALQLQHDLADAVIGSREAEIKTFENGNWDSGKPETLGSEDHLRQRFRRRRSKSSLLKIGQGLQD